MTDFQSMALALTPGSAWSHVAHVLGLLTIVVCYVRWVRSRRGTWMVGVGVPFAWLVFSGMKGAGVLGLLLWGHAIWVACRYARGIHVPCPHHSRLPRPWRRFACGNLLRCRTCHMLYPLGVFAIALGVAALLLAGVDHLIHP
jgi:hypothetical protein